MDVVQQLEYIPDIAQGIFRRLDVHIADFKEHLESIKETTAVLKQHPAREFADLVETSGISLEGNTSLRSIVCKASEMNAHIRVSSPGSSTHSSEAVKLNKEIAEIEATTSRSRAEGDQVGK